MLHLCKITLLSCSVTLLYSVDTAVDKCLKGGINRGRYELQLSYIHTSIYGGVYIVYHAGLCLDIHGNIEMTAVHVAS